MQNPNSSMLYITKTNLDQKTARAKHVKSLIKYSKYLNKDITLGDYEGIKFFGIGISNSKIIDKEYINSKIEAKTTYIGIMPIRSLLNQKWIINIKPKNTSFNINKDFLRIAH